MRGEEDGEERYSGNSDGEVRGTSLGWKFSGGPFLGGKVLVETSVRLL